MKSLILRVTLLFLLIVLFIPNPSQSATTKRTALVIGNSKYSTGPLKNPVNDATDMASALRRLGFTVILKKNADLRAMEDAIIDFGNRLKGGGVGLFYYAGHGLQVSGVNYLIPIGARIDKGSDVKYETVDAEKILDEMANANNGLNIVILDACRDNPYARSFRSAARGLAIVSSAPVGTFISYSTSPGSVARDGEGRNSPYTAALLQYMKKPGLTIESVFKNVRTRLGKNTGGRQIPWELSSLQGDFYFVPGDGGVAVEKAADKTQAEAEKESPSLQSQKVSSFEDLKRKLEERREREEQLAKDFEDAKKIESESSDITQKIQVWKQFIATLPDERTPRTDKIRKYASNRAGMLDQWRKIGKATPREIKNDGRFIAYDDGTVLDTRTNLMWASRDNGPSIQQPKRDFFSLLTMSNDSEKSKRYHDEAKRYCENYRGGGYTDWRMPSRQELQSLYDRSKHTSAYDRGIHLVTDMIHISVIWTWASETKNNSECYGAFFNMNSGGGSHYCPGDLIIPSALPVRSVGGDAGTVSDRTKSLDEMRREAAGDELKLLDEMRRLKQTERREIRR